MRLEHTGDGHAKFWEAEVLGAVLVVRWGRIGSDGQRKEHTFASEQAAVSERDKLAREKLRKGYAQVRGATDEPAAIPRGAPPRTPRPAAPAKDARAEAETLVPSINPHGVRTWTLLRGDLEPRDFFELSAAGRELEISRGKAGGRGRVREVVLAPGEDLEQRIAFELAKALRDGFRAASAAQSTPDITTPDIATAEDRAHARAEAFLAAHARTGFVPVLEDGPGEIGGSRFGGLPALEGAPQTALTPCCGACAKPMSLIVQLRHDELPDAARATFAPGLLQLFWCDSICAASNGWEPSSQTHLARTISLDGPLHLPRGDDVPEMPYAPRRIVAWRPVTTYPGEEELDELAPSDEALREDVRALLYDTYRMDAYHQGERLLGWPSWLQSQVHARCTRCLVLFAAVLQLDTNTTLKGLQFGDSGKGYLLACPKCKATTFTWQSC